MASERFTDRARRAVTLAQAEARAQRHPNVGTGHLLTGLASEDSGGVAQLALAALGVTVDSARGALVKTSPRGDVPPLGHIPFTPDLKQVTEDALREALCLGHNYIGTEHLLLALARPAGSHAGDVIDALGLTGQDVREAVLDLLGGYEKPGAQPGAATVTLTQAAPLPPAEAVMWADEPAVTRLGKMIADLDGYIERRAEELAQPQIDAAARLTPERMAREFHEAAGLPLPAGPTLDIGASFVSEELRQKILDEEVGELAEAVAVRDLVAIADALADIAYVVAGTAVTYGIPFDAVLAEVHRSNMSKFGPDGPAVRDDGKIIKGPGYEPPDLGPILEMEADGG